MKKIDNHVILNRFIMYLFSCSSIATYEEIMPRENATHNNQHPTNIPKGTGYCLFIFALLVKEFIIS
jgi:PBP1b-binding outer membrane lipoprotein LpoB